ncbi:MAG TPA: TraR/DksA C4-type zinc finger protein [Gemmataceae bacterium]|jgi:RNA polymerase-binding protein DksA|nr:TraR/DksA C4-type zinc finger protein [Gemmataceae bacterium]
MLSKKEIERYRRRLLALQKHLSKDVAELEEEAMHPVGGENSGNLSDVPVHPADLGTDNFEEELDLNLIENKDHILADIEDALQRIEDGTYGRCQVCGQEIPRERLDAVPYTTYCIRHARKYHDQAK